jgi:hypothetical protein
MRLLVLAALLSVGCSWKNRVKKLSDTEIDHYYALRVFMNEGQHKAYLKTKEEEDRSAMLKSMGLWDKFYKLEPARRQAISDGKVEVGWTAEEVRMSWGTPFDTRNMPGRKAERSKMWVFRFEEQQDGSVLVWEEGSKTEYHAARFFQREVILDNDIVAEIHDKNEKW